MAAGRDVIGSSTHVHQAVPLPRADEVDPPLGVAPRLPFRTQRFVGRVGKLAELDVALAGPGGTVVQAVHGLGGVGKSTLAAHWAHRHAADHTLTWWITADSAAGVTAGLAELAQMLVPELARDTATASSVGLPERADWARQWLATHAGWLVVLDNVTHPEDVADLVTGAPDGRFLITSRLREGWDDIASALVELDVLSPAEALELLRGIITTGRPDASLDGDAALCAELGYLPLALRQAAAYIRQTRITPARYLAMLEEQPAVMYDRAARGSDASRTMARIWRLTLDALTDTPLAGHVLRILAWWAPEDIPRNLLDPLGDPVEITTALGDLAAYNMIGLEEDTVTVHRLVQAVARTPDPRTPDHPDADPHRRSTDIDNARHQATDLLKQATPTDFNAPAGWPTWRALLPHIDALAEHAPEATDTSTTSLLVNHTAIFLIEQGDLTRALGYFERALNANQRLHGDDHPKTLIARNNLAGGYRTAGDLGNAIPLFERSLTDHKRIMGDDHPDTLNTQYKLAVTYESAGDLSRAIPLLERTLSDHKRVLGDDHPDTLNTRDSLAFTYQEAGDPGRAIPLYEHILTDCERVLGDDHSSTLNARNNLAYTYQAAGDLGRTILLYERVLADRARLFGDDHPSTLTSRNNLAGAYQTAGDLRRAIPLYERTLSDCERVLGDEHPSTLNTRHNLASAYREAGDLWRALPLCKRTLADCERVLGHDHPLTLNTRNNLAAAYRESGNPRRAIPLFKRALADRERVLGHDHPDTLTSRNNLAAAYDSAGAPGRAIPLYERTLADCERVLGGDHPDTLNTRNNLAAAYGSAGNPRRAIPLLTRTLADCESILGFDHPLTKTARANLEKIRK
ncbi:tetratricopeptide repeat protein [Actinomadura logoneensis]|uniref:tetratricopeptide repeat protein n=1 Tax=Actinomadura logoneensis TaxID=2293572 RepID=UPI001314575A|nr:tetratricopeptide repeat protein [Actinomadura logoneensis]